jgi:hypothetical protein
VNFDWYAATVRTSPEEVLGELAHYQDGETEQCRPLGGYRFARAAKVIQGRDTVATVMWDGPGSAGEEVPGCFVLGTGRHGARVAMFMRGAFPSHAVSRADVACDYSGPGSWERLCGLSLKVADKHGVKVEHAGDWHRGKEGRSIYVGGRMSVTREICYEKGKQLGTDPDHVRVELRVRPGSRDAKFEAAKLAPKDFFGSAAWSRDLAAELEVPEVQKISLGTIYRESDVQRAEQALLHQYGRTLWNIHDREGGWDHFRDWFKSRLVR